MPGYLANLGATATQLSLSHQSLASILTCERCQTLEQAMTESRKDSRRKEVENEKQIALLSQRCDILTIQLRECEEREANMKRMHHAMITALDSKQSSPEEDGEGREKRVRN